MARNTVNHDFLGEWQPATEVPSLRNDGCSREVLISSHGGYYVGYTDGEDWFESYNGDKVPTSIMGGDR